jgi:hypothetical protein
MNTSKEIRKDPSAGGTGKKLSVDAGADEYTSVTASCAPVSAQQFIAHIFIKTKNLSLNADKSRRTSKKNFTII